jgi:hypothetical protein
MIFHLFWTTFRLSGVNLKLSIVDAQFCIKKMVQKVKTTILQFEWKNFNSLIIFKAILHFFFVDRDVNDILLLIYSIRIIFDKISMSKEFFLLT